MKRTDSRNLAQLSMAGTSTSAVTWRRKWLASLACLGSQLRPFPGARSIEAVEALAKWRGSQMSLAAAEAFVAIRRLW